MMLVIYLDPSTPDTVHEVYTFKFSYKDGYKDNISPKWAAPPLL